MFSIKKFLSKNVNTISTYEEAYHHFINKIVLQQIESTNLVLINTSVKKIFVDGGFSKNEIYMQLLANAFPKIKVYAASVSQASAMGAALIINNSWNKKPAPENLIELKMYKPGEV